MEAKVLSEKLKTAKKYYVNNPWYKRLHLRNGAMYLTNGLSQYSFTNEIFNDLDTTVDFNLFKKIIDKIKKGNITISKNDDEIIITSGNNKFSIITQDENREHLRYNIGEVKECIDIDDTDFNLINKAFNYVIKNEVLPSLEDVHLRDGYVYASDKYALCFYKSKVETKEEIVVKTKLLGSCNVNISDNCIEYCYSDEKVIELRDTCRFPNTDSVIPQNNKIKLKINKKDLLEKLQNALLTSSLASNLAVLDLNINGSRITSENTDSLSTYSSDLPSATGDLQVGIHIPFLINVLKTEKDEETTLSFGNHDTPIIINDKVILMTMIINK